MKSLVFLILIIKINWGSQYFAFVSVIYENSLIKENDLLEALNCANSYLNSRIDKNWNITVIPTSLNLSLTNKGYRKALQLRNNSNYSAVIGPTKLENIEFLYPYVGIKSIPYIAPLQQIEFDSEHYSWLVKMTKPFREKEVS